jgi:hypothetical protein
MTANSVHRSFVAQLLIPPISAVERATIAEPAQYLLDRRGASADIPVLEDVLNRRAYGLFEVSEDGI